MENEKIAEQYMRLVTGAYHRPSHGINSLELSKFINGLVENGHIDCEDTDEVLDDYLIPSILAFLLSKKMISLEDFKKLVEGTHFGTNCINYKESYEDIIKLGVNVEG